MGMLAKKYEISIFIPVYKDSKLLPAILTVLANQNISKEIFVIIDEPTSGCLETMAKFEREARFIINEERVGKANALNEAVKLSSAPILLFLDADIEIPPSPDFLSEIVYHMKDADVLDIKKEITARSLMSRIAYYELVGSNICTWLMAKFLKKCPVINGSAFAIRRVVFDSIGGFRKVISEDLDIATRIYLKNWRFNYLANTEVYSHVKSGFKDWMIERRRWAIGTALWLREWGWDLMKSVAKQPQTLVPILFLLFPSLAIITLNLLTPHLLPYNILSLILLLIGVKASFLLPILVLTHAGLNLIGNVLTSLFVFLTFASVFFVCTKLLAFRFKIYEFFIYYFFYSLLTTALTTTGILPRMSFYAILKLNVSQHMTIAERLYTDCDSRVAVVCRSVMDSALGSLLAWKGLQGFILQIGISRGT